MTIPQNKGASTRTEFGDLHLLDLFVMPRSMTEGIDFRWAIGPYFIFPTATSKSAGRGAWRAGPAAAFRYRPIAGLQISGLIQQATSFAYTSSDRTPVISLTFQPMISYQLGHDWYVRSSDATWTFNLRRGTSTTIPLSGGLGKVWKSFQRCGNQRLRCRGMDGVSAICASDRAIHLKVPNDSTVSECRTVTKKKIAMKARLTRRRMHGPVV